MKEIVERLQEQRKIEQAKSILESNGYIVSNSEEEKLKESEGKYSEKFWNLYDNDPNAADKLEDILADMGIGDEDNNITEELAKEVLERYEKKYGDANLIDDDAVIQTILDALYEQGSFKKVETFREAGLMTANKGFVATTPSGKEFQFSLLGSY